MGLFDKLFGKKDQMTYEETIEFLNNNVRDPFEVFKAINEGKISKKTLQKLNKKYESKTCTMDEKLAKHSVDGGLKCKENTINAVNALIIRLSKSDNAFNLNITTSTYSYFRPWMDENSIYELESLKRQSRKLDSDDKIGVNEVDRQQDLIEKRVKAICKQKRFVDCAFLDLSRYTEYYAQNNQMEKALEISKLENALKQEVDSAFKRTDVDVLKEDYENITNILDLYYIKEYGKDIILANNDTELRFDPELSRKLLTCLGNVNPDEFEKVYSIIEENILAEDKHDKSNEVKQTQTTKENKTSTAPSSSGISDGR